MRIVHLWDQANFVKNLMNLPQVTAFELDHFPKLPDFGLQSKLVRSSGRLVPFIYSRMLDNFILAKSREAVYFEFHSAPLLERHANLVPRSIFHVHGSEVRSTNKSGQIEDATSEFTRYALRNAPLVFYSTPELIEIIGKYSSRAIWMPHITNLQKSNSSGLATITKAYDLVIPSSFEIWKGSEKILDIVKGIRESLPSIKIVGINLGSERESARQLAVDLFSVSVQKKYHQLLLSADAAVGQGFGAIGAADVESVQLGLRFFPVASNHYSNDAYGFEPDDFAPQEELISRLLSHILEKESRFSRFEGKVLDAHDSKSVISKMSKAYREYLS